MTDKPKVSDTRTDKREYTRAEMFEACRRNYEAGLRASDAARLDRAGIVIVDLLASLVAASSLLKSGSKKAAPSDRMFDQMLVDYERSVERGRAFLSEMGNPPLSKEEEYNRERDEYDAYIDRRMGWTR